MLYGKVAEAPKLKDGKWEFDIPALVPDLPATVWYDTDDGDIELDMVIVADGADLLPVLDEECRAWLIELCKDHTKRETPDDE